MVGHMGEAGHGRRDVTGDVTGGEEEVPLDFVTSPPIDAATRSLEGTFGGPVFPDRFPEAPFGLSRLGGNCDLISLLCWLPTCFKGAEVEGSVFGGGFGTGADMRTFSQVVTCWMIAFDRSAAG